MLEWLEVRLDVGCNKRLVYEYRIELLKCDRDALKQLLLFIYLLLLLFIIIILFYFYF